MTESTTSSRRGAWAVIRDMIAIAGFLMAATSFALMFHFRDVDTPHIAVTATMSADKRDYVGRVKGLSIQFDEPLSAIEVPYRIVITNTGRMAESNLQVIASVPTTLPICRVVGTPECRLVDPYTKRRTPFDGSSLALSELDLPVIVEIPMIRPREQFVLEIFVALTDETMKPELVARFIQECDVTVTGDKTFVKARAENANR